MALTANHIFAALQAAGARTTGLVMSPGQIAEAFNNAMIKYGDGKFDTTNKVAALVSECMMESAYFRTTEEYNKTKGSYQPYRGRSFIQITWKSNYDEFGVWCRGEGLVSSADYFVKDPARLADLKWAAIGGVWYFTKVLFHGKPLTEYSNNIEQVGKAVNLGDPFSRYTLTSLSARSKAYKAVQAQGSTIIPSPSNTGGFDMAAAKDVYERANKTPQVLTPGSHALKINNDGDYTIVGGPNSGVDIIVGVKLSSDKGGVLRLSLFDFDKDGKVPTKLHHARVGQGFPAGDVEVSAQFKGSIGNSKEKGDHDLRLRVVVDSPGTVTVKDVQTSGWKM